MNEVSLMKKNYINYINKIVKNKKISHTYLIEIDDYEKDFSYIMDFIKMILCELSYEEIHDSKNSIITLIDHNNYPDIKIIEPDGSVIKKNQLLDLQKEYSNKSLLDNKRIYVIKEAEKLNVASSNTMLKFLEEPEDNIVAILVTKNRYHLLETILSRCQILTLKENHFVFSNDDVFIDLLRFILNPRDFFLKYNYFINNVIVDKAIVKEKLHLIENVFICYLNKKYGLEMNLDSEVVEILSEVDEKKILNYLYIIEEEVFKLNYNINYKLWIDSLFSKLIIGG